MAVKRTPSDKGKHRWSLPHSLRASVTESVAALKPAYTPVESATKDNP